MATLWRGNPVLDRQGGQEDGMEIQTNLHTGAGGQIVLIG